MASSLPKQSLATVEEELLQPIRLHKRCETYAENSMIWGSKRLVVIIYMFFGFVYHQMLRNNLSIAIVEMTSNKTVLVENQTVTQAPEFAWDSKTKGWVLSVFFYGHLFSVVGGYMATKIGGGTVYGLGILVTAVLTVLSPFALRTNLYLFVAGRIAEGLFESFSYASGFHLWSRWIPKKELPLMLAFSHSGMYLGSAITMPLCGYIAHRWGWWMIFYFSGTVALIWCLAFFATVKNDPSLNPNISEGELRYIKRTVIYDDTINIVHPWRKIITSKPVWAVCICKVAFSWAYSFIVICMPLYVKDITNKATAEVGFLSGIPSYASLIVSPIVGFLVHSLQNNYGFDVTKVHKWTISAGLSIGGILFILISFTNFTGSMICFVIIIIALSTTATVVQLVIIHIAPNHAGVVAGISAFWYTLSSFGNPLAIGYIVTNHTWQQWSICFILSGIILLVSALIIFIFGSSEDQKWSSETPSNKIRDSNDEPLYRSPS